MTAQEEVRGAEAAPGPPQPEPRARQHGACQLATVRRVFQLPGNLRAESRRRRQVLPLVREFRSKCIISLRSFSRESGSSFLEYGRVLILENENRFFFVIFGHGIEKKKILWYKESIPNKLRFPDFW